MLPGNNVESYGTLRDARHSLRQTLQNESLGQSDIKGKRGAKGDRESAGGCWVLTKTLGPLSTYLESSNIKVGHWKCGCPHTPFFKVTRNSACEAKKETMKSEVNLKQRKVSLLTAGENV